jgi:ESF2/ABP1 family protein
LYLDAWVEFKDKRIAKAVAESLNNTTLGGKKRSRLYDAVWHVKYLSGFKWHHLTDKIRYDNAVRDQKIRAEISEVKRTTDAYMQRVDKQDGRERRRKRAKRDNDDDNDDGDDERDDEKDDRFQFRQRAVVTEQHIDDDLLARVFETKKKQQIAANQQKKKKARVD